MYQIKAQKKKKKGQTFFLCVFKNKVINIKIKTKYENSFIHLVAIYACKQWYVYKFIKKENQFKWF